MLTSPMTLTPIPSVEQISETVVAKPGNLARDRQTQQASEPRISRRAPPNLDGTVGANEESPFGVHPVQPAAYVLDPGTEAGERRGLQIDVAEFDGAALCSAHEAPLLPFDAAVTDGTFGVVPDDKLGRHLTYLFAAVARMERPCSASFGGFASAGARRRKRNPGRR